MREDNNNVEYNRLLQTQTTMIMSTRKDPVRTQALHQQHFLIGSIDLSGWHMQTWQVHVLEGRVVVKTSY